MGECFTGVARVQIVTFVIAAIERAQFAQKESHDWMRVDPFRTFAEPAGFGPDYLVNDFFHRRQNPAEVDCVLAIQCNLCRRLYGHDCTVSSGLSLVPGMTQVTPGNGVYLPFTIFATGTSRRLPFPARTVTIQALLWYCLPFD